MTAGTEAITLVPDELWALPLVYGLDKPVSTHPFWARGYSCVNCYLLREGNEVLLVDTGFPALLDQLYRHLDALLREGDQLSVLVLRVAELNSVSNLAAVLGHYPVKTVHAATFTEMDWVSHDPRPRFARAVDRADYVDGATLNTIGGRAILSVDGVGNRALELFRTSLQMLAAQQWCYDAETKTMFTGETFCYIWRDSPEGPWLVGDGEEHDMTTVRGTADFLAATRFWWLCGADTEPIWRPVEEILESHEIDRIAPSVGCIIEGSAVPRHIDLLARAIRRLGDRPLTGASLMPS